MFPDVRGRHRRRRRQHLDRRAHGGAKSRREKPSTSPNSSTAFNKSAAAIARSRERAATWRRYASSLPSSTINHDISNSSVENPVPSSPIAEPQFLGSSAALSTMTRRCAPEPPASVFTTVGANPMPQSYQTSFSVTQLTHG